MKEIKSASFLITNLVKNKRRNQLTAKVAKFFRKVHKEIRKELTQLVPLRRESYTTCPDLSGEVSRSYTDKLDRRFFLFCPGP